LAAAAAAAAEARAIADEDKVTGSEAFRGAQHRALAAQAPTPPRSAAVRASGAAITARELLISEALRLADDLGICLKDTLMEFLEVEEEVRVVMAVNARESLT
jgi:hypothetical protein